VRSPGDSVLKLSMSWKGGTLGQELRCSSLSSSVNSVPQSSQNFSLLYRGMVSVPMQIA